MWKKDKNTKAAVLSFLAVTAFRVVNMVMGWDTMTKLDYVLFAVGILLFLIYLTTAIINCCRNRKDKKNKESF